jgi:CRP-like cAMP-binding protein
MKQDQVRNRLLKALPSWVFELLQPHMAAVELPLKTVLVEPNEITSHIYFIESGLGSIIATSPDGEVTEVAHVGFEGMSGSHIVLMSQRVPSTTLMQVAGSATALPSEAFFDIIERSFDARRVLLRYVHAYQIQLAYTALANVRYDMPQRLARWLLMSHDRLQDDDMPLTHQFLSIMLGVRRSGVTDQIHVLEGLHAIRSTRGVVHIRDRGKLREIAGGCYGVPEKEYERLVGEALKPADTDDAAPPNGIDAPRQSRTHMQSRPPPAARPHSSPLRAGKDVSLAHASGRWKSLYSRNNRARGHWETARSSTSIARSVFR